MRMDEPVTTETLLFLTPEIVVAIAAVVIYVGGAFVASRTVWGWIGLGGILLAAAALFVQHPESGQGPLAGDALGQLVRWLALAAGGLLVLMAARLRARDVPEYLGSLLLTIVGLMLVAGADELIILFLGLELIAIPTYLLLYLGRRDVVARESAAKYFFLSILATALLLYGFSCFYGTTGSTDLRVIAAHLATATPDRDGSAGLVKVALAFVFAALGFKIAAVPFHFYAPDVYQGTTNLNAAMLSILPKAAGMVGLIRLGLLTPGVGSHAWQIALVLAAVTMTYGNVLALWQENLRRLLAYSSIAHAGTMLIGLAVGLAAAGGDPARWDGIGGLLFYLCVYAAATIGVFAALVYLGREGRQLDNIDELAGLGQTRPAVAGAIAACLFSLAGVPPLAGFWGKLVVFASALDVAPAGSEANGARIWFIVVAVIGALNAAVAAAYYLRVVGVMYFRLPLAAFKPKGGRGAAVAAIVCALLVVALGLASGPLLRVCYNASPRTTASNPQSLTPGP
jgi:NADH-quinone oxidoreductase subunit N